MLNGCECMYFYNNLQRSSICSGKRVGVTKKAAAGNKRRRLPVNKSTLPRYSKTNITISPWPITWESTLMFITLSPLMKSLLHLAKMLFPRKSNQIHNPTPTRLTAISYSHAPLPRLPCLTPSPTLVSKRKRSKILFLGVVTS